MEIVDRSHIEEYVTVEVERTVKVGRRYRIVPSDMHDGIEEGLVEVSKILSMSALTEAHSEDHELYDVHCIIEAYVGAELELAPKSHYSSTLEYLDNTLWVAYYYPSTRGEVTALPLDIFVRHTTY